MSPSESVSAVAVRGLRKRFRDVEVLKGVDVDVPSGGVVALIGPSGSGKTTVLRCLNGLEVPDAGTVEFAGDDPVDFSTRPSSRRLMTLRDHCAMVFQQYNLFPHLTALENVIEAPVRVKRRPRDEAVAEARALLERVGLQGREDSYPYQLSGGQQQRVGIVRALALHPDLLLLDEPTSALDPELVGEVLAVIRSLADEGRTMAIVTHELSFARRVADTVLFLDGGVIVESGPPDRVLAEPAEERTRRFIRRLLDR